MTKQQIDIASYLAGKDMQNVLGPPKPEKENKKKPCPYCLSVKNEWGTCSWHCFTCENKLKDCRNGCDYKHEDDDA